MSYRTEEMRSPDMIFMFHMKQYPECWVWLQCEHAALAKLELHTLPQLNSCKASNVTGQQCSWYRQSPFSLTQTTALRTSACGKSQGCKVTSIPLNRTQCFSTDLHLTVIIISIKVFTISPVYEVSLFGKIIRVAVQRGFVSVSLIFNQFLHVCRIFSWLWINNLCTTSYRWNFRDQHLIWRSSNKLLAPVFFKKNLSAHKHEVGSNMWKQQDTFWKLLFTECKNELLVCTEEP
jgi:hypothetical protein